MTDWFSSFSTPSTPGPLTVSVRTLSKAIEETLMSYTRHDLAVVLADELELSWTGVDIEPADLALTKRDVIRDYTARWEVPQLVGLARRIVAELDFPTDHLNPLLTEYDKGGGVRSPVKNLIFAANGPKPELVLKDAVSNDIQITRNAEHCLIYERDVPADGLTYLHLIDWWRDQQHLGATTPDTDVGRHLHIRLKQSLGDNPAEQLVLETYAKRYRNSFNIPALIPQVYLHYDPYTTNARLERGEVGKVLKRQRMDFLLLFSSRHRVVIEVDGRQHYADDSGRARTDLYAQMVAEDRRLRLTGYDVYRFGGAELIRPDATDMLTDFFDRLTSLMS